MSRSIQFIILVCTALVLWTACVPAKKYQALQAVQQASESEISRLQRFEQAYQQLQKDFQQVNQNYQDNGKALRELVAKYDRLNETYNSLLDQYDHLIDEKQQVMQNSSEEMNRLKAVIQEKDHQIEQKQREIWDKEMELENRDTRLAHLAEAMDPRELQAKNLLVSWDEQRLIADTLEQQLTRVLAPIAPSVMIKSVNGSVEISLSQSHLFDPENGGLSESGKTILHTLVPVCIAFPDWMIQVVGHTSNEGNADFNWDLSAEWAGEVVKEMARFGLDPARLTASGRSFYDPEYPEGTPDEKLKNRRITFLMRPGADLLMQLIGSE